MRYKIQSILRSFIIAVLMIMPTISLMTSAPAYAGVNASKTAACEGIGLAGGDCNGKAGDRLYTVVNSIITILLIVVGIVAVVMIIISGFKYITSGGDATKVASAKNTIIYALVGLIVVALAKAIVYFVYRSV